MSDGAIQDNALAQYRQDAATDTNLDWLAQRAAGGAADEPTDATATAPQPGGIAAVAEKAAAIGKDVAVGTTEVPRAIATGVIKAANSTIDMVNSGADWIDQHFPVGGIGVGKDGLTVLNADEYGKLQAAGETGFGHLPNWEDPQSETGKVVQAGAQFAAGFFGAGKLKGVQALKEAGTEALSLSMLKGAISNFTAFDPHQERLSNLIQSVPALQNPVTDFLASKPDDGDALGRMKNALEGVGLGGLAEGVLRGLSTLRSWYATRSLAQQANEIVSQTATTAGDTISARLGGSQEEPLVRASQAGFKSLPVTTSGPATQGQAVTTLTPVEKPATYINFARIDTPEDVQTVMQRIADTFKRSINTATRGKQTFEEIALNADQQNAWKILAERRTGQPLNAEQSLAARNLWAASGEQLTGVARAAVEEPSPQNLFAFQKMLAVHRAIQDQVIGARTETARALAQWRIPAGSGTTQLSQIDNALAVSGGRDTAELLAQRVAALASGSDREAFIEGSAKATTMDLVKEAWINGLLSGPQTHLVNAMSNTAVLANQIFERATATRIARALGDGDAMAVGEASAQVQGLFAGIKDAVRYAGKSFNTGESGFGSGKVELPIRRAWSSDAMQISGSSWLGKTVDVLGAYGNVPVRALGMADEFYKTLGYRMELSAQAFRQASREGLQGDALKGRMAEIIANPPEQIRLASVDAATYATFTNAPGAFAKRIMQITSEHDWAKFIIPFVRTPANIMNYAFERTPLGLLMGHVRADIAAGGERGATALSRLAMGTTAMMVTADAALNGYVTGKGPSDPAQREAMQREGWQPYAFKVGSRYIQYQRLDPLSSLFGLSADMVEMLANSPYGDQKQRDFEQTAVSVAMSAANNVLNKTYLSGLSNAISALHDPEQYGETFVKSLAGSVIPAGVAQAARIEDPIVRQAQDMVSAMQKRTPYLSEGLPPMRDLWGREINYRSGLGAVYDAVSPLASRRFDPQPIDKEILRLEANPRNAPSSTQIHGVKIDLDQFGDGKAYSRYTELAGNALKNPENGLGALDFLNGVVTGKLPESAIYGPLSDGPDGAKSQFIQAAIDGYRKAAKEQLLKEFSDLADAVSKGQAARIDAMTTPGTMQED